MQNFLRLFIISILLLGGAFLAVPLANAVSIPGSAEIQRLHDVMNTPDLPAAIPSIATPVLDLQDVDLPANLTKQELDKIPFMLKSVTIQGVTAYPAQTFLPVFEKSTGQNITVAELYDLVNKITATYRNDGYVLAKAILPPQEITEGHVKIRVVEGRLSNVRLEGERTDSRLLNTWAKAIQKQTPLNNKQLERYLLLMNDLPGIDAESTLRPGDEPATAELVIHVTEDKYSGSIGANNWGTRYVGPNQVEGDLTVNSAYAEQLDWHDQTTVRGVQAASTEVNNLRYLDVTHGIPLNDSGTKLEAQLHHSLSEPGFTLEELELQSTTSGFNIALRHPVIRSRRENLNIFGMFDWRDTNSLIEDNNLSEDHIRALRIGLNYEAINSSGVTTARVELSRGLNMFGASKPDSGVTSRENGVGNEFTKLKIDAARLQRLHKRWNLLLAGSWQQSTHALLASEEFGVGGENYGRGYESSEITGDRGFAAKAELQIDFPVGWNYLQSWQFYTFYDIGLTWQLDTLPGEDDDGDFLSSKGFGIRTQITPDLSTDLTIAKPLSRGVASSGGDDAPNIYFRIKNRF